MKENKLIIIFCLIGLTLNIWGTDIWDKLNHTYYIEYYNSRIKYIEEFNIRITTDVKNIFYPYEIVSCGFKLGMDNFSDYLNKKINNDFIIELAIDSDLDFEESMKKIDKLNKIIISDSVYIYLGREDIQYCVAEGFPDYIKWQIKK